MKIMIKENDSTNKNSHKFVILGAGINGICCAVRLMATFPGATIQIISESFSPHTTTDVAAGLWGPYSLGGSSEADCRKWAQETHDYLLHLWRGGYAEQCGICLIPVFEIFQEDEPLPWWHNIVFGFQRHLTNSKQFALLGNIQSSYSMIHSYVTFSCEPSKIMNYYKDILLAGGAEFRKQRLESINCLEKLNIHPNSIVINCLGLGSSIVCGDTELRPMRGQVQKVKVDGIFHSFADGSFYIIPNADTTVLGGTKQHSHNTILCPVDRYNIRKNCEKLIPLLQTAQVVKDQVGLRPVRSAGVRLESTSVFINGEKHVLVHNYGHGGAGITLAWGCSGAVTRIVQEEISYSQSKL